MRKQSEQRSTVRCLPHSERRGRARQRRPHCEIATKVTSAVRLAFCYVKEFPFPRLLSFNSITAVMSFVP